jgi:hypothetical protein
MLINPALLLEYAIPTAIWQTARQVPNYDPTTEFHILVIDYSSCATVEILATEEHGPVLAAMDAFEGDGDLFHNIGREWNRLTVAANDDEDPDEEDGEYAS